jgi:hypothetical protein
MAALIATYHLGDPFGPRDSWRAWRRKTQAASAGARGRSAANAPLQASQGPARGDLRA